MRRLKPRSRAGIGDHGNTMPALLCTLGSSWAVVPEAFLLGNGLAFYDRVLVLTSSGTSSSVEQCHAWFAQHHPQVALTILAVEDLPDLATAEDHHRFEEALYLCYFSLLAKSSHEEIHVCLAGGFKTMSAAAQEAAGLLGCAKLFHITSPLGVRIGTHEEILAAIADHSIRLIDLGSRSGWPTMRELASEALPAPSASGRISVGEATPLRDAIQNRLEAANRLSASEKELATLPFPQIARWAPSERDWLNHPLDPAADEAWLLALPKVELHCHLGGFATHGELLDQVRAAASDPAKLPIVEALPQPAGWPATVLPHEPKQRLSAYMKMGDNTGSNLLRDPGCLAEHCRLLFQHLVSQNIVYAEIRCSPANYATEGRSPWTVLSEIKSTFDECVTATVPVAESVPACFQLADSHQFHPFENDADYRQTWRDLPHRHQSGATAFVTFRLADSLPAARLQSWHREQTEFLNSHPKPWDDHTWNLPPPVSPTARRMAGRTAWRMPAAPARHCYRGRSRPAPFRWRSLRPRCLRDHAQPRPRTGQAATGTRLGGNPSFLEILHRTSHQQETRTHRAALGARVFRSFATEREATRTHEGVHSGESTEGGIGGRIFCGGWDWTWSRWG